MDQVMLFCVMSASCNMRTCKASQRRCNTCSPDAVSIQTDPHVAAYTRVRSADHVGAQDMEITYTRVRSADHVGAQDMEITYTRVRSADHVGAQDMEIASLQGDGGRETARPSSSLRDAKESKIVELAKKCRTLTVALEKERAKSGRMAADIARCRALEPLTHEETRGDVGMQRSDTHMHTLHPQNKDMRMHADS
jgi:hypothetical protein